jgi:hypothetical protein
MRDRVLAVIGSCVLLVATVYGATNLRVSSNGHYIETTSGTPFLYLNDTEWIINKHPDSEIISLLNDRQAKGFTVIKISTAGLNYGYGVDSRDFNGNLWYDNNSVTQLNTAFWARIQWIADSCAARNLWLEATIGWPGRKEGSPVCQTDQ